MTRMPHAILIVVIMAMLAGPALTQTRPAGPASRPANGWDKGGLKYERPKMLVVEEATPTAAQMDWKGRPPEMADAKRPLKDIPGAKPRLALRQPFHVLHL